VRVLLVAAFAALVLPAGALADLTFHPLAMGEHTYASWKAKDGQHDSMGNADQAFYLQNGAPRRTAAAGLVHGIEGLRADLLVGLSYEHRDDSVCTPLAPRWTIFVQGRARMFAANLGCATSPPQPGSTPGWTRRSWPQAVIRAALLRAGGTDALRGTITRLALVLDLAGGSAWLDNITARSRVETAIWTYAGDNGQPSPGPLTDAELQLFAAEPTAYELMTNEELLATLSEEEWAIIREDADEVF
jgi:hypothetical protein